MPARNKHPHTHTPHHTHSTYCAHDKIKRVSVAKSSRALDIAMVVWTVYGLVVYA